MSLFETIVLAVVQGITEFLPISSSGHLVLLENFLDLPVEDLKSFDVAVHVGTLLSILAYFWRDLFVLIRGIFVAIKGKNSDECLFGVKPLWFLWFLIIGTVPAVIVGLGFENQIDGFFRDGKNVAYSFMASGLFFIVAELIAKNLKNRGLNGFRAFFVGVFQAVAIIPGISRSGSTIGAGLTAGLTRDEAARFSFLLGIPALMGAGLLTVIKFDASAGVLSWQNYTIGLILSFISGYVSIYILMSFLKKHSLAWFSVYLLPLGIYLLFG